MTTYTIRALPDGRDVLLASIEALDGHLQLFARQQEFALTIHEIDTIGKETSKKEVSGVRKTIFEVVESKHQI